MTYPRLLTPDAKPFDPLEVAKVTEKIVTRRSRSKEGLGRKYVDFYSVPVYRGIATGYAVGCCLRCIYCWSNWSRDFPERFGEFYSPKGVAERLYKAAEKGITFSNYWRQRIPKIEKLRLSGCEPTIGIDHLLSLLELISQSKYKLFILETNGILLGAYSSYAEKISKYKEKIYVRVSFKAATSETFTKRTGAVGEAYELPFKALKYLLEEGVYARAAAMTDPRVMPSWEREKLKEKLNEIDPNRLLGKNLEEEVIDPYDTTKERLKVAGVKIKL